MSWFTTLFSSDKPPVADPQIIDIVEQAINVVDPRIRAVDNYQKILLPAAQKAWEHVCNITRHMPEPTVVAAEQWANTPILRALFATPSDINAILSQSQELQDWSGTLDGKLHPTPTALLVVQRQEITRLGVVTEGDSVRHDVPQKTISFKEHRVVCPVVTPSGLRREIKRRALHQIFLRALDSIQAILAERQQLEEQRNMLQNRLRLLQQQRGELSDLLQSFNPTTPPPAELAAQLAENVDVLMKNRASLDTLDDYLHLLADTLNQSSDVLIGNRVSLNINSMNIIEPSGTANTNPIELTDVTIKRANSFTITVVPIIYDVRQLEQPHCNLENAERYL